MSTSSAKTVLSGNRTGIATSPDLAEELMEGAASTTPSSEGGAKTIAEHREEYIAEGFPIGSMPMLPASEEAEADEDEAGMATLLDKMSERLAFERMGTRLYEALLNKCQTLGESSPGPMISDIEEIGRQELDHFLLLHRAITELGGDATEESPSADLAGVTSLGILQVVTDPRTSIPQSLQAMLTAELTDNAGWELLIKLADHLGFTELKNEFQTALDHEEMHLRNVRSWVSDCVLDQAQV